MSSDVSFLHVDNFGKTGLQWKLCDAKQTMNLILTFPHLLQERSAIHILWEWLFKYDLSVDNLF